MDDITKQELVDSYLYLARTEPSSESKDRYPWIVLRTIIAVKLSDFNLSKALLLRLAERKNNG